MFLNHCANSALLTTLFLDERGMNVQIRPEANVDWTLFERQDLNLRISKWSERSLNVRIWTLNIRPHLNVVWTSFESRLNVVWTSRYDMGYYRCYSAFFRTNKMFRIHTCFSFHPLLSASVLGLKDEQWHMWHVVLAKKPFGCCRLEVVDEFCYIGNTIITFNFQWTLTERLIQKYENVTFPKKLAYCIDLMFRANVS